MSNEKYMNSVHFYGRIWMILIIFVMLGFPLVFSIANNAWPSFTSIAAGLAPVALIFYPSGIIEVFAFSPLLGAGGTYLSFVSGNISNLKLPCALASMESAKVRANSEEGEIISTISIAASTIVTSLVITAFVIGVTILMRVMNISDTSEIKNTISAAAPALDNALPALFGALGASYFYKYFKISVIPILVVVIVLLFNGSLGSGVLVPVGVVVSLLSAHIMYKKGMLNDK